MMNEIRTMMKSIGIPDFDIDMLAGEYRRVGRSIVFLPLLRISDSH